LTVVAGKFIFREMPMFTATDTPVCCSNSNKEGTGNDSRLGDPQEFFFVFSQGVMPCSRVLSRPGIAADGRVAGAQAASAAM
jgi:hypothetical protein